MLDKNLEVIGSIEGLAEDERVYSARFMGDTGYFVTFRQMDPLFSVDLSDPKKQDSGGAEDSGLFRVSPFLRRRQATWDWNERG